MIIIKAKLNLNELELFTAKEASLMLGKSENFIRQTYPKYPNRFLVGSIRKIGRELIITQEGIDHLKKSIKNS